MTQALAYKKMRGLTIIKTMVILLVAGIVGSVIVNYFIGKRCAEEPSLEMCAGRQ